MLFADIEMELRNIQLQIPKGLQMPQDLALCALGNQWKQTNKLGLKKITQGTGLC